MKDDNRKVKFAGLSDRMVRALDDAGLVVNFPTGEVDVEELAFDWEFQTTHGWKTVFIDLRHEFDDTEEDVLVTQEAVDQAVARQFVWAYDNFDVDDEVALIMNGTTQDERRRRGVPEASELVRDIEEEERMLEHFRWVAEAVVMDRPVPKRKHGPVELSGVNAESVLGFLRNPQTIEENPGIVADICRHIKGQLN